MKKTILKFAGIITDQEANKLAEDIKKQREISKRRTEKIKIE